MRLASHARAVGEFPQDNVTIELIVGEWLDNLDWDVLQGDILAQEADALVCTMKVSLASYGTLGPALYERLGRKRFDEALHSATLAQKGRDRLFLGEVVSVPVNPDWGVKDFQYGRVIMAALWDDENHYTRAVVYRLFSSVLGEIRRLELRSAVCPISQLDNAHEGGTHLLDLSVVQVLRENDALKRPPSLERLCFMSNRAPHVERLRTYLEAQL